MKEHKADRVAVVREVLAEAGIEVPAADRLAADVLAEDGLPRYAWEPVVVDGGEYAALMLDSLQQTLRWRREYDAAKQRLENQRSDDQSRASPISLSA